MNVAVIGRSGVFEFSGAANRALHCSRSAKIILLRLVKTGYVCWGLYQTLPPFFSPSAAKFVKYAIAGERDSVFILCDLDRSLIVLVIIFTHGFSSPFIILV
jgi:hypothetical protein